MIQAAEVAAESRRLRGRKPKAPQYYRFRAALTVRPPFFELANEERMQAPGSPLAEPGWRDGYAAAASPLAPSGLSRATAAPDRFYDG
jgi:hypothetical protein